MQERYGYLKSKIQWIIRETHNMLSHAGAKKDLTYIIEIYDMLKMINTVNDAMRKSRSVMETHTVIPGNYQIIKS